MGLIINIHVLYGRIKYQSGEIWYMYKGVDEIEVDIICLRVYVFRPGDNINNISILGGYIISRRV